jgi:hypothetical protein
MIVPYAQDSELVAAIEFFASVYDKGDYRHFASPSRNGDAPIITQLGRIAIRIALQLV